MKKVAFIVSHFGSGSFYLVDVLNENPRCTIFGSKNRYEHPDDLQNLFKYHKLKNHSGAIYGDQLLYNHSFSCKSLYDCCKFIYVIRPARQSLNEIYKTNKTYSKDGMVRYYRFRLRRICEMAKRTKNAVLLTYDELISGECFGTIQEYLKLIDPLHHLESCGETDRPSAENNFSEQIISEAQDCYEKYFYYLSKLPLIRPK